MYSISFYVVLTTIIANFMITGSVIDIKSLQKVNIRTNFPYIFRLVRINSKFKHLFSLLM